jgi:hypothetical protein
MYSSTISGIGPWFAWWQSADGHHRKCHYFPTREEAQKVGAEWQRTLNPGEEAGVSTSKAGCILIERQSRANTLAQVRRD